MDRGGRAPAGELDGGGACRAARSALRPARLGALPHPLVRPRPPGAAGTAGRTPPDAHPRSGRARGLGGGRSCRHAVAGARGRAVVGTARADGRLAPWHARRSARARTRERAHHSSRRRRPGAPRHPTRAACGAAHPGRPSRRARRTDRARPRRDHAPGDLVGRLGRRACARRCGDRRRPRRSAAGLGGRARARASRAAMARRHGRVLRSRPAAGARGARAGEAARARALHRPRAGGSGRAPGAAALVAAGALGGLAAFALTLARAGVAAAAD